VICEHIAQGANHDPSVHDLDARHRTGRKRHSREIFDAQRNAVPSPAKNF
jgi:hypothetical protein